MQIYLIILHFFQKKIDTSKLEKIKNLLGLSYIFEKYNDEFLIDKNVEHKIRIKLGLLELYIWEKIILFFNNVINQNNFDKTTIDRIFDYLNEKFVIVLSNNEENFDNFSDFYKNMNLKKNIKKISCLIPRQVQLKQITR